MDVGEFREFAKASVDYIADYMENIRKRPVLANVEPGYLKNEIPELPPTVGEPWQNVLPDVDRVILPGLTHWHSPHFHAYFPTGNSFPGVMGELFSSGLGCISTDWQTSPACVELEVRVMDWLAKMLGLPEYFLNESEGPGGGVIQNAASESTLVGLLSGKQKTIKRILDMNPHLTDAEVKAKLVSYGSRESNSSVEKASLLASVPMRLLPVDADCRLRGDVLQEAIDKDKAEGLIPCCVVASLGTTGTCGFDVLDEVGEICEREKIWLHVDGAYAGAALVCPEYRYLLKGIEYVDSFNFNPHKWFLTNSDCSAMWFKNTKDAEAAFKLKGTLRSKPHFEPEIEHWQIPTARRFRALKLWFVMRIYGVQGLQKHIRQQVSLAKYLEQLVRADDRFELLVSRMGVVGFRLKGDDTMTQRLLDKIFEKRNLYIMPYYYQNRLMVRFVVCSRLTEKADIDFAWNEMQTIVADMQNKKKNKKNQSNLNAKLLTKVVTSTLSPEINEKLKVGMFL